MTTAFVRSLYCSATILMAFLTGCAGPPPRTIYQDPITSIRLYIDERAGAGHSHPGHVPADHMALVLSGVRVVPRSGYISSLITGQPQANPAFTAGEIQTLAPRLSRALSQATPQELVTFYRRFTDASIGLGITSGGMFVQDNHLFVILANHRNLPTEGMNQNMVTNFDPVDSPLIPISRSSFRIDFEPAAAVVPADRRPAWSYLDEGRILAINLQALVRDRNAATPVTNP